MMCLSFLVVYLYIVNVTYREFIAVHYTYVLIAFLIFADFSEVPIEKRLLYANRHSPLTLGLHAAVISPRPPLPIHAADLVKSAKKNRAAIHRSNILYHNTAVSPIKAPYTVFYSGGSIHILPDNKSP